MANLYVGKGGSDSNDGSTWTLRKLTLNGMEDKPVASGDIVYVGPGIYREMLTVDVDGTSEIQYIADVSGENTDGVGGPVIISGSDGDTTGSRAYSIIANSEDYRTFIGFHFAGVTGAFFHITSCNNWKIIDCSFDGGDGTSTEAIHLMDSYTNIEISRCFCHGPRHFVWVDATTDQAASGFTISDCLVVGGARDAVDITDVDSIVIENCSFLGLYYGVDVASLNTSQSVTVRNCIIVATYGFAASVSGEIASTYCQVTATTNTNWTAGTGDVENYVTNLELPLLTGERTGGAIKYPYPLIGQLNQYAYASRRAGTSETTNDVFGITKPTTSSKSSWGAIQYQGIVRETTTTHDSSTASLKLDDAGEVQFRVPVSGSEITISCYVYREANYAGTNPRMVIKQPGQSDRTTTDAAAASQWNQLTDTFTPSTDTDYVIVALQSLNTATSGSYAIFFDTVRQT